MGMIQKIKDGLGERTFIAFLLAVVIIVGMILFGFCGKVEAATITLTWDAPTENMDGTPLTDLAGFNVYYGTASGIYGAPIDVGNVTQTVVDLGPVESVTYYFVVTAYDDKTPYNESGYSNEPSHFFVGVPPGNPVNTQIQNVSP